MNWQLGTFNFSFRERGRKGEEKLKSGSGIIMTKQLLKACKVQGLTTMEKDGRLSWVIFSS